MAVIAEDTIYTKLLLDATQGIQELNKFASAGRNMGLLKNGGADIDHTLQRMKKGLGENSQAFRVLEDSMKKTSQQARQMERLGPMFAFMFGGMQMQRIGLAITKFVIPPMDKLNQLSSEGAKLVTKMNASWEFMKISMFETLSNTPLFRNFIEFIISAAESFAEFTQEHPVLLQMIAAVGGLALAIGTLAFGAGIFNQFAMMADYLGIGTGASGAKSLIKGIGGLQTALQAAGLGLTIWAVIRAANQIGSNEDVSFLDILKTAIIGGVGVGLLTWNPVAGVLAGGVILVTLLMSEESKDTIQAIQDAFNKPAELRAPDEAFLTGWQGTWLPTNAQTGTISTVSDLLKFNQAKDDMESFTFSLTDNTIPTVETMTETTRMFGDGWKVNAETTIPNAVSSINETLNTIPAHITTIHEIKTVYTGSGRGGSDESTTGSITG